MPKQKPWNFSEAQASVRALLDGRLEAFGERLPLLHRVVHFWVLVGRSFVRNRCPVRASALSYTTLLSLIPLLAVMLGITGVFLRSEGEQRISQFIERLVMVVVPPATSTNLNATARTRTGSDPANTNAAAELPAPTNPLPAISPNASVEFAASTNAPADTNVPAAKLTAFADMARSKFAELAHNETGADARKEVARYINEFIQNTRSGTLGATGMVFLLWMVYSLLSRIEETMNDIWGAPRGRNFLSQILNYWAAITLGPVLLIFGLGLASGPRSEGVRHFIESTPFIGGLVFKFVPLLLLWLAFTLFYQLIPNTKVRFGAAAIGGLIGGALWFGTNLLGSLYVSRVVTNSKIYGSLGLVPVFMIGLYTSWVILLFGAQVAYAWQNRAAYFQDRLAENVNQRGREFIALRLMTAIGQRFQRGDRPSTLTEISNDLSIPTRLIQQVMQTLLTSKLVVEVSGAETGYAPARPLESINCHHILNAMRATQGQELATRDEPARAEVYGEFARIQEAERQAASTVTILALVNRAQARLELVAPQPALELKSAEPLPPPTQATEIPVEPRELRPAPQPVAVEKLASPAAAEPTPAPPAPDESKPAEPPSPPKHRTFVPDDSPFPD